MYSVYLFEYRTRLIKRPLTSRELSDQTIQGRGLTAAEEPTGNLYRRTFAKEPDLSARDLEYLEARDYISQKNKVGKFFSRMFSKSKPKSK
jgi:hypothetical protein